MVKVSDVVCFTKHLFVCWEAGGGGRVMCASLFCHLTNWTFKLNEVAMLAISVAHAHGPICPIYGHLSIVRMLPRGQLRVNGL